MSYTTEPITRALKNAREARGLSQRELSVKTGVPQSHISKIENDAVDLRVSSLAALAHVLGLQLVLVPRKNVSAVNAIVRGGMTAAVSREARRTSRELMRLQHSVARLLQTYPTMPELAQLNRRVNELTHFRVPESGLGVLRSVRSMLKKLEDEPARMDLLGSSLEQMRRLRNELAHGMQGPDEDRTVRPAYGLDEDDLG